MKNRLLTITGYLLIFMGALLVIFLLYKSVNLTQGQSFIKYIPYWFASLGLMVGGTAILHNNEDLL